MSNLPNIKPVSFQSGETFRSSFPQRFKPKAGEAYRLFLPEVDCAFQARVHYVKPNYVFCLAGNGINQDCPACQTGDKDYRATWRYGMNVVLYKTDMAGNLRPVEKEIDGKKVDAFDWEVRLWLFAQTPANQIHSLRTSWDLMKHDVKLTCVSERPQKYDINPCQDSVFVAREDLRTLIATSIKNERRDPLKEMAVLQKAEEIQQAIAAGVNKKQNDAPVFGQQPTFGGQQQPNFPQQGIQGQAINSPSVISPKEGVNAGDAALSQQIQKPTGTETRNVSDDKAFDALLKDIQGDQGS
jgi:hypothetical protein